jgi:hypothetical protein
MAKLSKYLACPQLFFINLSSRKQTKCQILQPEVKEVHLTRLPNLEVMNFTQAIQE